MNLIQWMGRKRPSSPQMKAPVKVTVTAVKIRADGSREPIEVKNVTVTHVSEG